MSTETAQPDAGLEPEAMTLEAVQADSPRPG
jgi:hypothetical protein